MNLLEKETKCCICGLKSEQFFQNVQNHDEYESIFDLEEKCKIGWIQQCPHCFFASDDISKNVYDKSVIKLVASKEYQLVANPNLDAFSPLIDSLYHRYIGYSMICEQNNDLKKSILAKMEAANLKLSVAYDLLTNKHKLYPASDWEIIANVFVCEASALKEECFENLEILANEKPQNGLVVLLLLKNTTPSRDKIEKSLQIANNYLFFDVAKPILRQAIENEILTLQNILNSLD